jgi:hypothetical protein
LRRAMNSARWRIEMLFLNLSVSKLYYKVKTFLIFAHVSRMTVFKMKPYIFSRYLCLFKCMLLYILLYLSQRKFASLQGTQGCAINTLSNCLQITQ